MAVKLDEFGFPLDSRLRELHSRLAYIAMEWRGAKNNPGLRDKLVQEYHEILLYLYKVGWGGFLHYEAMLPDECMPEEFFRRYPEYRG
jgi:hypothetical protein